eukprot:scaffold105400_cov30-Tisochrysis_lutea.AAC.3
MGTCQRAVLAWDLRESRGPSGPRRHPAVAGLGVRAPFSPTTLQGGTPEPDRPPPAHSRVPSLKHSMSRAQPARLRLPRGAAARRRAPPRPPRQSPCSVPPPPLRYPRSEPPAPESLCLG